MEIENAITKGSAERECKVKLVFTLCFIMFYYDLQNQLLVSCVELCRSTGRCKCAAVATFEQANNPKLCSAKVAKTTCLCKSYARD